MRVSRTILILSLFVLLIASAPRSGSAAPAAPLAWQALGSPTGALTFLTADPADSARFYAVAFSASYRSDDGLPHRSSAGGRPRAGYALYQSRDAGVTWQPLTNNLPAGPITAFYADPVTRALFAGVQATGDAYTRRYGLWRSDDGGATWAQVALGSDDAQIRRITRGADNHYLYLGLARGESAPDSYVYRSADNGQTWEQFGVLRWDTPGDVLADLQPDAREPGRLYVTTIERGRVLRSTDAGATWTDARGGEAPANTQGRMVALVAQSPDGAPGGASVGAGELTLVRGGAGGAPAVERSTDGGGTWNQLAGSGLPQGSTPFSLAALPGGVFLLGTDAGAYRSADNGGTWRLLEGPLSGGTTAALVVPPGSRAEVVAATGYGLYVSRDAGGLWQALGPGLPDGSLPFGSNVAGLLTHPDQPKRVYALSGAAGPPPVLSSADGGRAWTPAWRGLSPILPTAWALGLRDPQTLYLLASGQFYRSADGGLTWQSFRPAFRATAIGVGPAKESDAADVLYLAGSPSDPGSPAEGQPLLRSDDAGATWQAVAATNGIGANPVQLAGEVTALVVDSSDANRLWAALPDGSVLISEDGGGSWRDTGLAKALPATAAASSAPALAADTASGLTLYAAVGPSVYRLAVPPTSVGTPEPAASASWARASTGLPGRPVVALLPDPRTPGTLWAALDGGGLYRSADRGDSWTNAGAGLGDNLIQALTIDYDTPGGILAGTVNSGIMALRPGPRPAAPLPAVDGRVEILWPHDWQPVASARLANIGLRLFQPGSLVPGACAWTPRVNVWRALNTDPAAPLDQAKPRTIDGQPFPYWDLNDVDVRLANDPEHKLYFMIRVTGASTATSIWAHGADPRTYFPKQDVPSGIATDALDEVDARIQIVWPHDGAGEARPAAEAALANVAVALFKHGTRLSVPVAWRPAGLTLFGAWNQEISRALSREAIKQVRQSGAIIYPEWEFQNVPVARALDPANKLYLWVEADGVQTYPTIWAHGADTRTFFPFADEPVQGCAP